MHSIRVLYVGDRQYREFAEAVAVLDRSFEVAGVDDLAAACRYVGKEPVDLVVAATRWPGEQSPADFEALREAAPFTPIVTLLGPWCEGEVRTGKPWPGAIRLYAHQFIPRLTAELSEGFRDASEELFSSWSPPLTKTHEDRLLYDWPTGQSIQPLRIGVCAKSRSAAGSLIDVLKSASVTPVLICREAKVHQIEIDAIAWDCVGGLRDEVPHVSNWRAQAGIVPVILLLGFPRQEDQELANDLGTAAIISKPFLVQEFVCTLQRITYGSQKAWGDSLRLGAGFNQSPNSATSSRTISRLQAGS
jgi:hypothetical protein